MVYHIKLSKNATVAGDVSFFVFANLFTRIGTVAIETNPAGVSTVTIGSPTSLIASLGSVEDVGTARVLLDNLWVAGSIGVGLPAGGRAISVDHVAHMFVGGDVLGEILVTDGPLNQSVVGGSVLSNITISNGALDSLTVTGDIAPVPPATTIKINVNGEIRSLIANSITADIANITYPNMIGPITSYIQTMDGGFFGSLKTGQIGRPNGGFGDYGAYGFRINGKLDANVTVVENILSPINALAFGDGRTIWIGSNLWGGEASTDYRGAIAVEAGGFAGQVIVDGHGGGGQHWTGPVSTGGVQLTPIPYYSTLSTSIGGGAVGEVPFNLHSSECLPPNGSAQSAGFNSILLDSYGPIGSDGARPLLVEFVANGQTVSQDITAQLIFVMHPNGKRRQIMLVSDTFNLATAHGDFRISPVRQGTSRLKCLDVDGQPNVSDSWLYTIHRN